jgi:hypothetical protein
VFPLVKKLLTQASVSVGCVLRKLLDSCCNANFIACFKTDLSRNCAYISTLLEKETWHPLHNLGLTFIDTQRTLLCCKW